MFETQLRADLRQFPEHDEGLSTCRRCGVRLYLLPEDRRLGYCFDCFDPSEIHATL